MQMILTLDACAPVRADHPPRPAGGADCFGGYHRRPGGRFPAALLPPQGRLPRRRAAPPANRLDGCPISRDTKAPPLSGNGGASLFPAHPHSNPQPGVYP